MPLAHRALARLEALAQLRRGTDGHDASGGHRHRVLGERGVGGRDRQQPAGLDQQVGAFSYGHRFARGIVCQYIGAWPGLECASRGYAQRKEHTMPKYLIEAAYSAEGLRGLQKDKASGRDRKSTRLNSSHGYISYAVFCLKKKKIHMPQWTTMLC